jgi:hypothetical protein
MGMYNISLYMFHCYNIGNGKSYRRLGDEDYRSPPILTDQPLAPHSYQVSESRQQLTVIKN